MVIRVFNIRFGNLKGIGFKSVSVHRPSVCPMCCIEHTLYHYYTTLGGGPICNFLRLFSSISSLPLTTLLQLILGLMDYFKNKWGQTKELWISFFYWLWVYLNCFEHLFICCFRPRYTKPFQDGATVTAKIKTGLKFSNPSEQFKVQQNQLKQIHILSVQICFYWSGYYFLPTKPSLARSESSVIMLSLMNPNSNIFSQNKALKGCEGCYYNYTYYLLYLVVPNVLPMLL